MRKNTINPRKWCLFLACVTLSLQALNGNDLIRNNTAAPVSYISVKKTFTVVIDAGHGGRDVGTVGKKSREKDIALDLALRLGKKISKQYPDVEVIYTRKTDVFIPLFERVGKANKESADLFISIHCNASTKKSVSGTETFVMGLHKAEENLETAKRENQSILYESDFEAQYDGYDPNSVAGHIILSTYQNTYLDQSIEFATFIEESFGIKKSRGVKQAGFVVLKKATMPSVLIETGFLSNAKEEEVLKSEEGQKKVVNAIFKAFSEYRSTVMQRRYALLNELSEKPVEIKEQPRITYGVQIAASRKINKNAYPDVPEIQYIQSGEFYKYVSGSFSSKENALEALSILKRKGFKQAFIIALEDKKPLAVR